ncbi:hypothetical protein ILYODFUR_037308 [Ilyodon furcidens]|uniref:Uncharacterized protein n=1 Tax=Ilyodon furcidens TaxID=33524 RepID=A0ABV0UBK2_9TELE
MMETTSVRNDGSFGSAGGHHQWKKSEILLTCWYMMVHGLSASLDYPGQSSWSSAWSWPQWYRGKPGRIVGLRYQLGQKNSCFH